MKYTEGYLKHLREEIAHIVGVDKITNKGILITGASGLIGSTLADLLFAIKYFQKLDLEIFLAGRNEEKLRKRFAFWTECGVSYTFLDYQADESVRFPAGNITDIIHCAANSHPAAFSNHPVETIMEAVQGLENILRFAKEEKAKVLYVSSSEIYGEKKDDSPYKESEYYYVDILNPRACYPSSKRVCETLCASYVKEYGLDVKIVRPGHIYGPQITEGDSRAHAQFLRDVVAGRNIVMKSEGRQLRSYCYSLDCASAMLSVLNCGITGEAYNISNPDSLATIRELALMHAKLTGRQVIFDCPSSKEAANFNMMSCSALNSDKIEALGWSGIYNLYMGVDETIACYNIL